MKNKNNLIYLIIGIAIGFIAAYLILKTTNSEVLNPIEEIAGKHESEEKHNEDVVSLTEKELEEFSIKINEVESGNIQLHSNLTGEIIPDPTMVAHIIPRFAGIVREVRKNMGDNVEKDEVIAVIESNESLVQYEMKSSITGTVIEIHMTPGEVIGDDKHVVTVANLTSVWASLTVYQKGLTKIKLGQYVEISTVDKSKVMRSKIFYVSPIVDKETRTASARVRLNNTSGFWKPGMFITGKVFTTSKKVPIVVNKNALQLFKGETVVFVQDKKGFRPQPVSIGLENNKLVEILSGLHKGQKYAAEGAFTIKSEFLKESFGGDHH
jgi:cobalt-zinc-cadmium efflux system membrane fusion protein